MINEVIADQFSKITVLLELEEKSWESRAFSDARDTILGLDQPITTLYEDGGEPALTDLPDVGSGTASVIIDYIENGEMTKLNKLQQRYPEDIIRMTKIHGVGPTTTRKLLDSLEIHGVDDLEAAAKAGKVQEISGLGPATQEKIIDGIASLSETGKVRLSEADRVATTVAQILESEPYVDRVAITGPQRRRLPVLENAEILVSSTEPTSVFNTVSQTKYVAGEQSRDTGRATFDLVKDNVSLVVHVTAKDRWGDALHWSTGPEEYIDALPVSGDSSHSQETSLYEDLGLPFVAPELRRDAETVQHAESGQLPSLVSEEDIRGDIHVHSKWSDGHNTVDDVAAAAQRLGYEYVAITDHSVSSGFAGGLGSVELQRKNTVVDEVDNTVSITVLRGSEVDILPDGSLDYEDSVLEQLDVVMASVHAAFDMSEERMTNRLVRAAEHPAVTGIGHMTGRLLLERPGYDVNEEAVFRAAAANNTAIEINSTPVRLDVSAEKARKASRLGADIVVNTDSHDTASLTSMSYGVEQARRAGLEADDIFNTKPVEYWL